jgi:hypothetical protein
MRQIVPFETVWMMIMISVNDYSDVCVSVCLSVGHGFISVHHEDTQLQNKQNNQTKQTTATKQGKQKAKQPSKTNNTNNSNQATKPSKTNNSQPSKTNNSNQPKQQQVTKQTKQQQLSKTKNAAKQSEQQRSSKTTGNNANQATGNQAKHDRQPSEQTTAANKKQNKQETKAKTNNGQAIIPRKQSEKTNMRCSGNSAGKSQFSSFLQYNAQKLTTEKIHAVRGMNSFCNSHLQSNCRSSSKKCSSHQTL